MGEDASIPFKCSADDLATDVQIGTAPGKKKNKRANWSNQIEYFITSIGYCVGLSNIWRFPYLCLRNGGGAFLIPYFFFLLIGGVPLYFLEAAISQFSSCSVINVWQLCPLMKGLGWAMIIVTGILAVYYQAILNWVLYYLVMSFRNPVPWANCDNPWNTDICMSRGSNTTTTNDSSIYSNISLRNVYVEFENFSNSSNSSEKLMTPSEEFWQYNNLEMTDGIGNLGGLRWQLVICHIVGWLINWLCVLKGIKSLGKVVYVTATVPYLFLIILLIRGATLPGAVKGILYYVKPDFNKLLEFKVWTEACMQIFYSLGASWGAIITIASYNKFNYNMYRDSMVVPLVNGFTSFFAGFVTFSVLGFMAEEAGVKVEDVISSGPGLAFMAYPEALAKLPFAPAWSVLFFLTLYTIGLDSQLTNVETMSSGIVDRFPRVFRKKRKYLALAGVIMCNAIVGLIFCSRAGIYYFQICDWYSGAFSVMTIGALECLTLVYLYGGRRFLYDMQMMLGYSPCIGWLVLIGGVTPIALLMCLVYSMVRFVAPYYGDYTYPMWAIGIGWILTAASLVPIGVCAVHQLIIGKGNLLQRLKGAIRPSKYWGPALEKHRRCYKYAEENSSHDFNIQMLVKTDEAN